MFFLLLKHERSIAIHSSPFMCAARRNRIPALYILRRKSALVPLSPEPMGHTMAGNLKVIHILQTVYKNHGQLAFLTLVNQEDKGW